MEGGISGGYGGRQVPQLADVVADALFKITGSHEAASAYLKKAISDAKSNEEVQKATRILLRLKERANQDGEHRGTGYGGGGMEGYGQGRAMGTGYGGYGGPGFGEPGGLGGRGGGQMGAGGAMGEGMMGGQSGGGIMGGAYGPGSGEGHGKSGRSSGESRPIEKKEERKE